MLSYLPRGLKTVLQQHTSTHFRQSSRIHASSWLSLNAVAAKTRSPSNSSATSTFQLPSRLSALPSLFEMDMIVATCPASHPRIIFSRTNVVYLWWSAFQNLLCGHDLFIAYLWRQGCRSSQLVDMDTYICCRVPCSAGFSQVTNIVIWIGEIYRVKQLSFMKGGNMCTSFFYVKKSSFEQR